MAAAIGKNLGKFKQWTGEKLGKATKTECSDEFQKLEQETDTKRENFERLYTTSEMYLNTLEKKKKIADEKNKIVPVLALGHAMVAHGQLLPRESPYGKAMIKVGEVQEQLASAQMEFAMRFRQDYVNGLERTLTDMKELQQSRKKLESRRLDYNAKLNTVQKTKKDKPELEDQMRTAEMKFHETMDDVHSRMVDIGNNEELSMKDLYSFYESQLAYFQRGVEIISSIKDAFDERAFKEYYSTKTVHRKQSFGARGESNGSTYRARSYHSTGSSGHDDCDTYENNYSSYDQAPRTPESLCGNNNSYFDMPRSNSGYNDYTPNPSSLQRSNTFARATNRASPPESMPPLRRSTTLPNITSRKQVRVLYGFDGETKEELSVRKGDIVTVIEEIDDGWWVGETVDDNGKRVGMFPSNYVEEIFMEPQQQQPPLPKRQYNSNNYSSSVDYESASMNTQTPESLEAPSRRKAPPPPRPRSQSTVAAPKSIPRMASANNLNRAMNAPKQAPSVCRPAIAKPRTHRTESSINQGDEIGPCDHCGCEEYTPNVFKKDNCNNCFHRH
ncbi:hypothetical protein K7432_001230 [Basidiobolus ranarum]|uniref:BAR-domain-containing protein n=1 Tax=Basidiobolus ranarum TaxID=34480 RepID=A0ABR2X3C0_9FUNG